MYRPELIGKLTFLWGGRQIEGVFLQKNGIFKGLFIYSNSFSH